MLESDDLMSRKFEGSSV